jgi:hypothetical protein
MMQSEIPEAESRYSAWCEMCHTRIIPDFVKVGGLAKVKWFDWGMNDTGASTVVCIVDYSWSSLAYARQDDSPNKPTHQLVANVMTSEQQMLRCVVLSNLFPLDTQ